ncbi:MAG TPA: hypothetical protein VHW70_02870 [Edaphobacter sp.]|nr:hypothetical protein [Edaphobacter sp.]
MRVLSNNSSCGVSSCSEAVLRQARNTSVSLSLSRASRIANPRAFGLAGIICHWLLSASARSFNSASDTDGFSGNPTAGISNAGAVGGNVCSEVIGSSENGAMMPFDLVTRRSRDVPFICGAVG